MDNPLLQYTALWRDNAAAIDGASAPALNRLRPRAFAALDGVDLPDTRTEGYEKTSLRDMFAPDYGVNISRVSIPVDAAASFRCDVPNLSTLTACLANDAFVPSATLLRSCPKGVTFIGLADAARSCPEAVEGLYGSLAPLSSPAAALNTLLAQDGAFIRVAPGCRPDKALQLVQIFSAPVSLAAFRRILIEVGDGASLRLLICSHTQDSLREYLASEVIEVVAGRNSQVDICMIEESSPLTRVCSQLYLRAAEGAEVTLNTTTLTCGTTRNEFAVDLAGRRASLMLSGMAVGGNRMHIDNSSAILHSAPGCKSRQNFKYVLQDASQGAFEGSITVSHGATGTEAYQSNRNILASPEARMHCKPQLIIYNDDVKCSHGATTGQLDQEAIFYMRQRGIPLDEARTMLMQAFMVDVIDTVRIPGLSERLRHLTERRFSGTLGECAACHARKEGQD